MNYNHDKKGRFASQKVYNKGKYYTTIYPENSAFEVFIRSYWIGIVAVLVFASGTYLHFMNLQENYCGLQAIQCLGEAEPAYGTD